MRTLLRDLARQPWRTCLTIAGIAIGIFALVVFGSLAEHFRALVGDSEEYVKGTIHLATKTNKEGENPGITDDDIAVAKEIPGVKTVVATITLMFDGFNLEDSPLPFVEPKPLVEGLPPEHAERMRPGVHLVAGRWLRAGDGQKVMVAAWLAKRRHYKVGDTIDVRHRPYEVIGFFEAPDIALIPAGIVPFVEFRKGLENPTLAHARKFFTKQRGDDDGVGGLALEQLAHIAEKFVAAEEERWYPHEVVPDDPAKLPEIGRLLKERLPHLAVIEPAKLAAAMEKFRELPTISGKVSFSPDYHTAFGRDYRVIEIQDNKGKYLEGVTAKEVPELG